MAVIPKLKSYHKAENHYLLYAKAFHLFVLEALPESIANSDRRHGLEFDCNQDETTHRLQFELHLEMISSNVFIKRCESKPEIVKVFCFQSYSDFIAQHFFQHWSFFACCCFLFTDPFDITSNSQ